MSTLIPEDNGPPTHPMDRLSPEVLSAIFIENRSLNFSTFDPPRAYGAPLIWMEICKRWRNIALSSPQLWAQLGFTLGLDGDSGLDLIMAGKWLARAKSCPLSLTVRSSELDGSTHPILDAIKAHCHHWQHINSDVPIFGPPSRSLPMLRTLNFIPDEPCDEPRDDTDLRFLHGFEDAPLLRNLTLAVCVSPKKANFPWSQLTQCSIHIQPQYFNILHQLSGVVNLSLMFDDRAWITHSAFVSSITFPHLRTLRLIFDCLLDVTSMLDHFIVPALYDITFHRSVGYSTSWGPQIVPFVSQWSSTIERITVCNAHLTDDELVTCIPTLQKLEIEEQERSDYVTNNFLQRLRLDQDDPLAPKLKFIGFKGFYYQFDDELFVDMVESRWRLAADHRVARLKAIMLQPKRTFDRRAMARLNKMEEEGLGVYIIQ